MDAEAALEFTDRLIFAHTGKHLSDLERAVFVGSWQGQTYDEIYPTNPEYVEKYVGYKLWQKLSTVFGEKVTKKKFRGAIERSLLQQSLPAEPRGFPNGIGANWQPIRKEKQRVFISYRGQEPDFSLARQFYEAIAAAGHEACMVNANGIPSSPQGVKAWLAEMDAHLTQCDYFLLLLSPEAAISEMVIEELQRAKELRGSQQDAKPVLLPIRVNGSPEMPINYDLQNYLQGIRQREWTSPADTALLVQDILNFIEGNTEWEADNSREVGNPHLRSTASRSTPPPLSGLLPTPLPAADPELPQGQVRLDSKFYIDRTPYESQCYREILQPGTLIRIKAPRQMGKTSLMSRVLSHAREQGYRTVPLSFQHADKAVFTSLDELLRWFCVRITRKLRLPNQVDQYWTDTYGSKDNCTAYFEDCLLPEIDSPLVLGLDEVDRVFQYPKIADDFFGLLRAWYEEAGYGGSDSGLWEKLRLVVVHSTEVYIPLDVNQSPFNVGLPIELTEFSSEQVADLAQRHGLNWQTWQIQQLMRIVGGHPYLVRVALYHISQQQLTLKQLVDLAPSEASIYGDHLRRHLWNLQQHPELAAAFSQVLTANHPVELESLLAFKLHSLGLVQLQGNEVTPRFELYRRYFGDRLS